MSGGPLRGVVLRRNLGVLAAGWLLAAVAPAHAQAPHGGQSALPPLVRRVYDLNQAVEAALRNHPSLQTAEARAQAAKTGIQAEGAKYRPFIQADASGEQVLAGDRTRTVGDETVSDNKAESVLSAALKLVVPVVREGKLVWLRLPSEEAAAARYAAVRQKSQLTRAEVIGTVAVTFFTALSAREDVGVSEQLVELNQVLLVSARAKAAQQLVPEAEIKAAEAALASAVADLTTARATYARSLSDVATAMGFDPSPDGALNLQLEDRHEIPPAPAPLEQLIKQASASHPLVQVQEAVVREAEATQRVLQSQRYPTVDFSTRLGGAQTFGGERTTVTRGGTTKTLEEEQQFWSLRAMLNLSWRLYDFSALGLRLKQQQETIAAERLALNQVRSEVAKGVVAAYRNVSSSLSRLGAAEKGLEAAEEQARATRERFRQNLIAQSELLQAEARLGAARKALIQAQNAVRIDQAILQIAMGAEKL